MTLPRTNQVWRWLSRLGGWWYQRRIGSWHFFLLPAGIVTLQMYALMACIYLFLLWDSSWDSTLWLLPPWPVWVWCLLMLPLGLLEMLVVGRGGVTYYRLCFLLPVWRTAIRPGSGLYLHPGLADLPAECVFLRRPGFSYEGIALGSRRSAQPLFTALAEVLQTRGWQWKTPAGKLQTQPFLSYPG